MVERGLRASGHRTGLYTSPHLDRIEERMAIDGVPVEPGLFDRGHRRPGRRGRAHRPTGG
jgi:dihydrofolate synthase / folylpolyglutamate synthase